MPIRDIVWRTPPMKPFIRLVKNTPQLPLLVIFKKRGKLIIVADKIVHVFSSGLNFQIDMPQSNELFSYISWSKKSCYIQNFSADFFKWGENTARNNTTDIYIYTCKAGQFFILTRQLKPVVEADMTTLWG